MRSLLIILLRFCELTVTDIKKTLDYYSGSVMHILQDLGLLIYPVFD